VKDPPVRSRVPQSVLRNSSDQTQLVTTGDRVRGVSFASIPLLAFTPVIADPVIVRSPLSTSIMFSENGPLLKLVLASAVMVVPVLLISLFASLSVKSVSTISRVLPSVVITSSAIAESEISDLVRVRGLLEVWITLSPVVVYEIGESVRVRLPPSEEITVSVGWDWSNGTSFRSTTVP